AASEDDQPTGPSVTLEISEPEHPASGPADEVAEVPSGSEAEAAPAEPEPPALADDDEPESKA
ncbi:hypothetical protein, partial [Actinoplanes nipponensis]